MTIFKPCDIRGAYPEELDEQTVYAIGRSLGTELQHGTCILAGDCRLSTPSLKQALAEGLLVSGANVIDIGIVPTPVAYWARRQLGARGAAIVTASHNPPHYNGVKLTLGDLPVTPEDMERIRRRTESAEFATGSGHRQHGDVRADYLRWLSASFPQAADGLTVLVDAGNGMASDWAPAALRAAGAEVHELYCRVDGSFPNRSPNPSRRAALGRAAEVAVDLEVDMATCFDGDADRVVFLDENGSFVAAEEILILLARAALARAPGSVVYDLKCTRVVPQEIERAGGRPVMERSGHAFIKRRLILEDALMAGEASGHFFFRAIAGDDGLYAALRVAELVRRSGHSLGELRSTIPPYYVSEDIRLQRPEGDAPAVVAHLARVFAEYPQDRTDGIRVDFPEGWALCRPSVTEPALTVRVEGDSPESLDTIRRRILNAIPE